ncbi:MAG: transcription termination factor NusA [Nitrospinae bacterium]|nr:transcription termination factor NusA [Nitrospinota bacterium]
MKDMDGQSLSEMIAEAAKERGVSPEVMIGAIESGILIAAQKKTRLPNLRARFVPESGEFSLWQVKTARQVAVDTDLEIAMDEARAVDKNVFPGADVYVPYPLPELGRMAATATRKVMQKSLKELEMENRAMELQRDSGKLVVGTVLGKNEHDDYLLKCGEMLAVLPRTEQAFRESFEKDEVVKVIVIGAEPGGDGPAYTVSRTHPLLLKHLIAREVPEVADGVVVVRALARDTAGRSKVAVMTTNPAVDPVGTCIGPGGARVKNIIKELKGENIDLIAWSDDPEKLITEALKPAKVKSVKCNLEKKEAWVELEPDQQAVAVGKKGLNIRLATRLTRWTINIV